MGTIKRTLPLFCLFLFLFICSCAVVAVVDGHGINQKKENGQDYILLLTLVVALVGIIALSGVYVQIMHKVSDNIWKAVYMGNTKSKEKGRIILCLLGWQIICFFVVIFSLMVALYKVRALSESEWRYVIGIPFFISQCIHLIVFLRSYGKCLTMCKKFDLPADNIEEIEEKGKARRQIKQQ
ncbi:MAG TPA: hypothetical protein ACFYD7_08405 [Candidatus Wujingus californicus]|uniref:hypothetical protein n=1 Tax=Candidatus Wujingus californicus TaxID=3367618 RepID=UPI001D27BB57|nr:hypothetical protein [Planctomycetota bacterium]MDO8132265.1 hypothetical protein [Candidatus Brocadiales bacterium]